MAASCSRLRATPSCCCTSLLPLLLLASSPRPPRDSPSFPARPIRVRAPSWGEGYKESYRESYRESYKQSYRESYRESYMMDLCLISTRTKFSFLRIL